MISIVMPTRNRAYILKKVLPSYFIQKYVTEIIFIDDCGEDNTKDVVEGIAKTYSEMQIKYIRHGERKGAAAGKNIGYKNASNEYILFGEDDVYLEPDYTEVLLKKMQSDSAIGLLSGRIIYKLFNETNAEAKKRFGYGSEDKDFFNINLFGIEVNAIFKGDIELPMTHALFLTTKKLLNKFGYDPSYARGNGYREESDFQMNTFINGYKIICTNDTHCYHMSKQEVNVGGQRTNRFKQLFWNIYFTNYFFNKYFVKAKIKLDIQHSKSTALLLFSLSMFGKLFIQPIKKIPAFLYRRIIE